MEVAEPARRRPHPQGCNEEEDGRDAVFWSAASARNGAGRGKNCGKRSAGRCGYQATGRLTSIMTRQRWMRGNRNETLTQQERRTYARRPLWTITVQELARRCSGGVPQLLEVLSWSQWAEEP